MAGTREYFRPYRPMLSNAPAYRPLGFGLLDAAPLLVHATFLLEPLAMKFSGVTLLPASIVFEDILCHLLHPALDMQMRVPLRTRFLRYVMGYLIHSLLNMLAYIRPRTRLFGHSGYAALDV